MELKVLIILVIFLLVSCNLIGVFGLDCYQCNSFTDGNSGCLDPMSKNVAVITCAKGYVCTKVSYVTNKTFVTSRSCDLAINTCNNIKSYLQQFYADLSSFKCYSCSTKYCNGNSGVTVGFSLVTVLCGLILSKIF